MTTRREVIQAAQAALVGTAGGLVAGVGLIEAGKASAAAPQSEIMRLMRECAALRDYIDGPDSPNDDEWSRGACERMWELERQLVAMPATTIEEFAAKILVWTGYASMDDTVWDTEPDEPILAEIRKLTGYSGS